jgi:hypothetical protein
MLFVCLFFFTSKGTWLDTPELSPTASAHLRIWCWLLVDFVISPMVGLVRNFAAYCFQV